MFRLNLTLIIRETQMIREMLNRQLQLFEQFMHFITNKCTNTTPPSTPQRQDTEHRKHQIPLPPPVSQLQ